MSIYQKSQHGTLSNPSYTRSKRLTRSVSFSSYQFLIPNRHFVPEPIREEIRDWVLALSMDRQITQTLPTRVCGGCGKNTWTGTLVCHLCSNASDACCVTGWPVEVSEKITHEALNAHTVIANRTEWNVWVSATGVCPVGGGKAGAK